MIAPKIVFEDSYILVIDKPSGVVVNRAETVKKETIQDWIEDNFQFPISNFQFKDTEFYQRSGIVHRLDKETSGLLIIAKTPEAFETLKAQFKERKVKKKYLALVHGEMEARSGEIVLPIKRLSWDRKKFGIIADGRKARTKFKAILSYTLPASTSPLRRRIEASPLVGRGGHATPALDPPAGGSVRGAARYTLLEVEPETGRTHQIRVHFKHLGHPLVGDLKYAGRRAKKDKEFCPRLFLHASYLCFTHPKTGKKMAFKSPLPQDLEKTLRGLKRT